MITTRDDHSPPTNVAQVDSGPVSYVGSGRCLFWPYFKGFSPSFPVYLPPQNNKHFQIINPPL